MDTNAEDRLEDLRSRVMAARAAAAEQREAAAARQKAADMEREAWESHERQLAAVEAERQKQREEEQRQEEHRQEEQRQVEQQREKNRLYEQRQKLFEEKERKTEERRRKKEVENAVHEKQQGLADLPKLVESNAVAESQALTFIQDGLHDCDPYIRRTAAWSLKEVASTPHAMRDAIPLLEDPDATVRKMVVRGMTRAATLGGAWAVDHLVQRLSDVESFVREDAAEELAEFISSFTLRLRGADQQIKQFAATWLDAEPSFAQLPPDLGRDEAMILKLRTVLDNDDVMKVAKLKSVLKSFQKAAGGYCDGGQNRNKKKQEGKSFRR
eukprot:TRINITY_DN63457_c0_g1_i1.p1 TRINITY_DN63457_c0_g1~~TRINITY_DN63457_c0_g1_i1.p1  ORF type:complete len:344 (+),score=96.00 TRINITY_DN63457_c0_g1_i1:53-1033(+)